MAQQEKKQQKPTEKQIKEWKAKAEKWDKLAEDIGRFYEEPQEVEGDLCDIGEIAASAFGYL